jgi:hypothetical protein
VVLDAADPAARRLKALQYFARDIFRGERQAIQKKFGGRGRRGADWQVVHSKCLTDKRYAIWLKAHEQRRAKVGETGVV